MSMSSVFLPLSRSLISLSLSLSPRSLSLSLLPYLLRPPPNHRRTSFPSHLPSAASTTFLRRLHHRATSSPSSHMAAAAVTAAPSNPLLSDFDFPPFDSVTADHVRPGVRALLQHLGGELDELEKTVEPTWEKLVEPLEKILDRLAVVWGIVNHLKAVQDSSELRAAIEDVQEEQKAKGGGIYIPGV